LNTPQFSWVKSRLPRKPQPVPPIYQPEVAAEAIVWVADHHRDEMFVGGSTAAVIWANKLAPRLGDRYLARTGFDSQQTDEPDDPHRPNNLWEPVRGDHGAHGAFDARAHSRSLWTWLTEHRRWFAVAAAGATAMWSALRTGRGAEVSVSSRRAA